MANEITTNWINDFVSTMALGKVQDKVLDDIAKENKATNSVPWLRGKGKKDLSALKSDATQRRNALRSMVKRAIRTHHALVQIGGMPEVVIEWITTDNAKHVQMPSAVSRKRRQSVHHAWPTFWFTRASERASRWSVVIHSITTSGMPPIWTSAWWVRIARFTIERRALRRCVASDLSADRSFLPCRAARHRVGKPCFPCNVVQHLVLHLAQRHSRNEIVNPVSW